MNNNNRELSNSVEKDLLSRMGKGRISWDQTSDEVWDTMQARIDSARRVRSIRPSGPLFRLAIAAAALLLFAIPTLMRFYTVTNQTAAGQHLDITMPDGSVVYVNAETTIKYHPMWWRFNRSVNLTGEAYFEVVKGSDFVVKSELASTAVLGTSFNIISRDNRYEVTCLTGRVKVFTQGNESELFLSPNERATLDSKGVFEKEEEVQAKNVITWKDGEFFFTSVPLADVFKEIERQYGISINSELEPGMVYTGNFSRNRDIEMVLSLVCKPFGIKFEQISTNRYLVTKNEDN